MENISASTIQLPEHMCRAQRTRFKRFGAPGLTVGNRVLKRLPLSSKLKQIRLRRRYRSNEAPGYIHSMLSQRVVFIRVPKCASTSICTALYGDDKSQFPTHLSAIFYDTVTPIDMSKTFVFATFRNPIERFASTFRHYQQNTKHRPEKEAFARFMPDGGSYDEFLERLSTVKNLDDLELFQFDHFRPQCDFICGKDGQVSVDHIMSVGNMSDGMKPVENFLERGLRIPHLNRTKTSTIQKYLPPNLLAYYGNDFELWNLLDQYEHGVSF